VVTVATTPVQSRLYFGRLVHRRYEGRPHRFAYPIAMLLIDLDELPELDRKLRLFRWNRPGIVAFHDRDHLGDAGRGLRDNVESFLERQGHEPPGGRIMLLTHARIFGYVFNPVSFYYCLDRAGELDCIVAEVNNTFGERHNYLLDARNEIVTPEARPSPRRSFRTRKAMYVSPFIGPDAWYDFHMTPPAEGLSVFMADHGPNGRILDATLSGQARPLTDPVLLTFLFRYPFMTLAVIGRIHWQAFRLWLKKVPHYRHVPRPMRETP